MCGICGIICPSTKIFDYQDQLERMNDAMRHRGPDDSGIWVSDHVGLGMRRLSVIDIFRGHQPMENEDGTVVLVFNGEIYNFRDLRLELEKKGHEFKTMSDTEVIIHAYEEYADDCLDRLNGMFAFALYDKKLDRLLLARDRLGIKPLFYTLVDGRLYFASELDAFVQAGVVSGKINPKALDAYFAYLYVPSPDTIFADVYKLCPGEKLVYQNGLANRQFYWKLNWHVDPTWTLEKASEKLRELLTDAVSLQRVSDVPLGAFLSGGVDSSSIVGLLNRQANVPIKTFTVGFPFDQYDEKKYAREVATYFNTDHTEIDLTSEICYELPRIVRHFGEPFGDSSLLPTWDISRKARAQVTVVLAGDGGDELFAGYTWTHMTLKVRQYQMLPLWLRHIIALLLYLMPNHPLVQKAKRFSKDSFRQLDEVFERRHTCFLTEMRAKLFLPDVLQYLTGWAGDYFRYHWLDCEGKLFENRLLHHDTVMYLPDDILTKVDRMSMAHSLEVRVPFLDHRIVEFAATLPFHLKYCRNYSKIVLKHAMARELPYSILRQRKQGFAVPIHDWFRKEWIKYFDSRVLSSDTRCIRFLSRSMINRLREAHLRGRENYGHHLWAILVFEEWLRYVELERNLTVSFGG